MSEKEYALIVGANLRRIANEAGKTQADVSKDLHIIKSRRMPQVQILSSRYEKKV